MSYTIAEEKLRNSKGNAGNTEIEAHQIQVENLALEVQRLREDTKLEGKTKRADKAKLENENLARATAFS